MDKCTQSWRNKAEEVSGMGDGSCGWDNDDCFGVEVSERSSIDNSGLECVQESLEERNSRIYRKSIEAAAEHIRRIRSKSKNRDSIVLEEQSLLAERALNIKKQICSGQADLPKSKAAPSIPVRGRSKSRDIKAHEQQSKQAERALNIKKQTGSELTDLPKSKARLPRNSIPAASISTQTKQDIWTEPQPEEDTRTKPEQSSNVETQTNKASTIKEKTIQSVRITSSFTNLSEKVPAYLFVETKKSDKYTKITDLRLGNPETLNFLQKFYLRMSFFQRHTSTIQRTLILFLLITLPLATMTSFYNYVISPKLQTIITENFYTSSYNAILNAFNTFLHYLT